ncbi:biliverdin-producing heme oxygenase [Desertivirga brevis]|uniref:biliverdin-producing heme oxygenase n=1 Tax=Desertivirga brevis TaxID=2810310 RepID=UPI001A966B0B|nr:biliverdin-producing heme oxygenase [Pedobacter sp. SYSU D00873]
MKLSLVLKDKTIESHQQLEKLLIGKLKSLSVEGDYVEILRKFYGYIKPLEEKISKNLDINIVPDYAERRKSDDLMVDLRQFRADPRVVLCEDLPEIKNTYEALGALYVLEGSTLGGTIITKMVTERLGIPASEGVSFFYSYGDRTREMWDKFKGVLDALPEEVWKIVIESADETFIKFKDWLA